MNIYKLLKLNRAIRSNRLKLLLIFMVQLLNRRYYSVRIDPIFACNLRCLMCYFSKSRKAQPKTFSKVELELLAKNLFGNALQVMVGCGAEPTIHPDFIYLVELAKRHNVPHVGIVTNGQLLSKNDLLTLSSAGLNELTLSVHATQKETYENFMVGAKWEKLIGLLENIKILRDDGKIAFSIRMNFTANPDNIQELEQFFDVFGDYPINTLQVRPIMEIGGAYFKPFSCESISLYNSVIESLFTTCKKHGITLLANTQNPSSQQKSNPVIAQTYKYVSPQVVVDNNFRWQTETYRQFLKRTGWHKAMLKSIFSIRLSNSSTDLAERYGGQYDVL
ncbi:MAG: radical SAM protein [Tenuifilum sp.]|uniref:radical SAM protein n=1 Tax=Tenuifilum sp. TaxID=2760880 RepID=UPI002BF32BEA|nr:radical SAM protein [Tenuifilum sp.]HOK86354.1 radical SAM protein [Tenuifilum sp.]HON70506.1 radical SAM protein [Tenuifilum sp.]HOU74042.1 radical SAM protein [Tenuifilum sp.]HPP90577.1 radical SAM protein [Tenuifilum sp.]